MSLARRAAVGVAALLCLLAAVGPSPAAAAEVKPAQRQGLFGISPQEKFTGEDAAYMRAGGIETVRAQLDWGAAQPGPNAPYDWGSLDENVTIAALHGLRVMPFVIDTPSWLARNGTTLPLVSPEARAAWSHFLEAAVRRYGPEGEFWREHAPGAGSDEPPIDHPLPIRTWQIWNEANYHYFAYPVSPSRYGRLLRISSPAIKRVDPGARVITAGLFSSPDARGKLGMPATTFLDKLYHLPGIEKYFDGISVHPYSPDLATLEELVYAFRRVAVLHDDQVPLYITELGWGSQNDPKVVSFERGYKGQARNLRRAYRFLLSERKFLDLKNVFWFSWKDLPGTCSFCDSVGLFGAGEGFHPKPAWYAFVRLTGGRLRP